MPDLELKERDGRWYACGTVAGKRIRKSLGTRDKARAQELKALLEAREWKRHSYGDAAVRTFEEAATSYLEAGGDRRFVPPLLLRFKGRSLHSITPEDIKDAARTIYGTRVPKKGASPIPFKNATRNRQAIVPAVAIINHAAERGWCHRIAVKLFPTEKPRRRAADRAWLDAFMAQADKDGLHHLAAAVLFMWQTGARVSETARVMPDHVHLSKRIVELEQTKTSEWEPCHITQELVIRLARLDLSDKDRPVFGYADRWGIHNRMKAVCRRAGIPFLSSHQAGRHSFATNALESGAKVKEVMQAGRWKTARMVLEIYAHADEAGKAVAEIFDTKLAQPNKPTVRKVK